MIKPIKMERKNALEMKEVIEMYIKSMKLSSGLNTQRIFKAWDDASGAAQYTVRKFFRDGKLYITLNSSVVRNQLGFQNALLVEKINAILQKDELFVRDDPKVSFVQTLILK